MKNILRRIILIAFAIAAIFILSLTDDVHAGDWRFQRSYYTHAVPEHLQQQYPLPESRSAYRPAVVGNLPGFSIQGGYRLNRIFLRSGNSTDLTIIREGWYRVR
ncbi:MAG: hypothetical protein Tsb009_13380 [Planctomycetaceae bacterium]